MNFYRAVLEKLFAGFDAGSSKAYERGDDSSATCLPGSLPDFDFFSFLAFVMGMAKG
jgi:hypothetical protein